MKDKQPPPDTSMFMSQAEFEHMLQELTKTNLNRAPRRHRAKPEKKKK